LRIYCPIATVTFTLPFAAGGRTGGVWLGMGMRARDQVGREGGVMTAAAGDVMRGRFALS